MTPKRPLQNTFRLDPRRIKDPAELRRLARNANFVRILAGKRGMSAITICEKFRLPISEAIQIRDSANEWRRSCEKAQ
ncbi:hypothetical protein [Rhizobium sp. RU35A]|uniref:hypothetical protein n=1 Tax=Rhizobium sp. RU35A TaxID=1907414 RepID=UPI00122D004E|nr:hypothetical protein [Rhizobium sp. RU35A]